MASENLYKGSLYCKLPIRNAYDQMLWYGRCNMEDMISWKVLSKIGGDGAIAGSKIFCAMLFENLWYVILWVDVIYFKI